MLRRLGCNGEEITVAWGIWHGRGLRVCALYLTKWGPILCHQILKEVLSWECSTGFWEHTVWLQNAEAIDHMKAIGFAIKLEE